MAGFATMEFYTLRYGLLAFCTKGSKEKEPRGIILVARTDIFSPSKKIKRYTAPQKTKMPTENVFPIEIVPL